MKCSRQQSGTCNGGHSSIRWLIDNILTTQHNTTQHNTFVHKYLNRINERSTCFDVRFMTLVFQVSRHGKSLQSNGKGTDRER